MSGRGIEMSSQRTGPAVATQVAWTWGELKAFDDFGGLAVEQTDLKLFTCEQIPVLSDFAQGGPFACALHGLLLKCRQRQSSLVCDDKAG